MDHTIWGALQIRTQCDSERTDHECCHPWPHTKHSDSLLREDLECCHPHTKHSDSLLREDLHNDSLLRENLESCHPHTQHSDLECCHPPHPTQ